MSRPLRVFVTGTDTGVGKTQVSCALLSLLADAGARPAPFKPYESGCEDLRRPADALALKAAARSKDPLSRISVHRFRAPLAPGVAAAREGRAPSFAQVLEAYRSFRGRALVAEGAGGLYVPLDARHEVVDLIARLKLPVVVVARAGLGTLNHTALTLEALERRRLPLFGVVLVKSTPGADPSEEDNADWLRRRHPVRVAGPVPFVEDAQARRVELKEALRPWLR